MDTRITDRLPFGVDTHMMVFALAGSHSHGTFIPSTDPDSIDDVDYQGVIIPPPEYIIGLDTWTNWRTQFDELDIICHPLGSAMKLWLNGNPNFLSLLWQPEETIIQKTEYFNLIRRNRDIFSSQRMYNSFVGYAHGQLDKMNKSSLYQGYMGPKRREIVDRYGYDIKNASHLIRILRMGIEFMETGQLTVDRTGIDADELIEIKTGKWTLRAVKSAATHLFERAKVAKEHTNLPDLPDRREANALLVYIHQKYLEQS